MPKRSWSDANGGSALQSAAPVRLSIQGRKGRVGSDRLSQSSALSRGHRQSTGDVARPATDPNRQQQAGGTNGTVSLDQHLPQISRKIKACAACRKHKVGLYL